MADDAPTLDEAAARLDRALSGLEARIKALKARTARGESDLFDAPAAASASGPSERERRLEEAATEASAALARAADEVRTLLNAEA